MKGRGQEIVVSEVEGLKERIIRNITASGQVASGSTIRSLEVISSGDSVKLLGRSPFGTMEDGRKAGRIPRGFYGIIAQWMRDKGIKATPIPYIRIPSQRWQPKYTPEERGDMSLAGAIAHKIKKEGTKLYREGGRDDIYSNEIPETIKTIKSKLLGLYKTEVENIQINKLQ